MIIQALNLEQRVRPVTCIRPHICLKDLQLIKAHHLEAILRDAVEVGVLGEAELRVKNNDRARQRMYHWCYKSPGEYDLQAPDLIHTVDGPLWLDATDRAVRKRQKRQAKKELAMVVVPA